MQEVGEGIQRLLLNMYPISQAEHDGIPCQIQVRSVQEIASPPETVQSLQPSLYVLHPANEKGFGTQLPGPPQSSVQTPLLQLDDVQTASQPDGQLPYR